MNTLIWLLRGMAVVGAIASVAQPSLAATGRDRLGATCAARHVDATAKLVQPDRPPFAALLNQSGTVEVEVDLDEAGALASVAVSKSSGNKMLDAAALDAVRQSAFTAETVDCKPIPGSYAVMVDFPS